MITLASNAFIAYYGTWEQAYHIAYLEAGKSGVRTKVRKVERRWGSSWGVFYV